MAVILAGSQPPLRAIGAASMAAGRIGASGMGGNRRDDNHENCRPDQLPTEEWSVHNAVASKTLARNGLLAIWKIVQIVLFGTVAIGPQVLAGSAVVDNLNLGPLAGLPLHVVLVRATLDVGDGLLLRHR